MEKMLFEAFFWNPRMKRPDRTAFMNKPEFKMSLSNWGRRGDTAFIAQQNQVEAGVAWYRLWTNETHFWGFVDDQTPELGIAVEANVRGQGIGRQLLRKLINQARSDGFPALSLSVDPANFARQLYESEGFEKVGESGTSWTMLLRF